MKYTTYKVKLQISYRVFVAKCFMKIKDWKYELYSEDKKDDSGEQFNT